MDRADENIVTVQAFLPEVDPANLLAILEGLLFAAGTEGLAEKQISRVLCVPENDIPCLCDRLAERQSIEGRMFRVERIAEGWQLVTSQELNPYLCELALAPPPSPLSRAATETLAIIAYKQPITRSGIEEIRGVKSERALGTLVARGLVEEVGRAEGPGRPFLYGTTREFLEYFGLGAPGDLPPLTLDAAPLKDDPSEV